MTTKSDQSRIQPAQSIVYQNGQISVPLPARVQPSV
jgi:hypothetical protein